MLLTGKEYLESIRDGRKIYIGSERVDDVTAHPAFRNAARSFADIYDRKRAPENRDVMESLPKTRFLHIDDGARQGSDVKQRLRTVLSRVCRARPYRVKC